MRLIKRKVTSLRQLDNEEGPYTAVIAAAGASNELIKEIGKHCSLHVASHHLPDGLDLWPEASQPEWIQQSQNNLICRQYRPYLWVPCTAGVLQPCGLFCLLLFLSEAAVSKLLLTSEQITSRFGLAPNTCNICCQALWCHSILWQACNKHTVLLAGMLTHPAPRHHLE